MSINKKSPLLTIAIPVFNENDIVDLVKDTYSLNINKEIIIIDDGSTYKNTLECYKKIKSRFPDIKFIHNKKNIGKALSIQKALKEAQGEYFVILDSDYELHPKDIFIMYEHILRTQSAFVNGYRVIRKKDAEKLFSNKFSRFSRYLMGLLTKILYNNRIRDVLSGFKMFKTELFREYDFSSQRFGLETEFIVATISMGKKISEIDVGYYPRTYKEGKKINIFDSFEILWVLFKHSTFYSVLRKSLLPAFLVFVYSFMILSLSDKYFPTTDALPNTYVTFNIIENGRFDLTNLVDIINKRGLFGIYVTNDAGIVYPKTSVLLGIIAVPFFKVANIFYGVTSMSNDTLVSSLYGSYIGKIYASFLVALSTSFLYLALKKILPSTKVAIFSCFIYLVGTHAYNIAAQSNTQHAISLLLLTSALYVSSFKTFRSTFFTGLIIGFSTLIRISNGFYSVYFLLLLFFENVDNKKVLFKKTSLYILGCLTLYIPITLWLRTLDIPNGYANEIALSFKLLEPVMFSKSVLSIFFSPNFGLFMYEPFWFALLLIPFVWKYLSTRRKQYIVSAALTSLTFVVFACSWWMWTGGLSMGARLIVEAIPLGIIILALSFFHLKNIRFFKVIFMFLLVCAIGINILTTQGFDQVWWDTNTLPGHESQIRNAWFVNPPYLVDLMQRRTFYIHHMYKRKDGIYAHVRVYRPSIKYKGIVKIYDGNSLVLKYE